MTLSETNRPMTEPNPNNNVPTHEDWNALITKQRIKIAPWNRDKIPTVSASTTEQELLTNIGTLNALVSKDRWWFIGSAPFRAVQSMWSTILGRTLLIAKVGLVYAISVHFLWLTTLPLCEYTNMNIQMPTPYFTPWDIFSTITIDDVERQQEMTAIRAQYNMLSLDFPYTSPYTAEEFSEAQKSLVVAKELWPKIQEAIALAESINVTLSPSRNYVSEQNHWNTVIENVHLSVKLHPLALRIEQDAAEFTWKPTYSKFPYVAEELNAIANKIETMKQLQPRVLELVERGAKSNMDVTFSPPYDESDLATKIEEIEELEKRLETHKKLYPKAQELIKNIDRILDTPLQPPELITEAYLEDLKTVSVFLSISVIQRVERFLKSAERLGWSHNLRDSIPNLEQIGNNIDGVQLYQQVSAMEIRLLNLERQLAETMKYKSQVRALSKQLSISLPPPYNRATVNGLHALKKLKRTLSAEEFGILAQQLERVSPYMDERKIKKGSFLMGCPDIRFGFCRFSESPQHTVNMPHDYMVMKTEVTNGIACALLPESERPSDCTNKNNDAYPAQMMFKTAVQLSNSLSVLYGLTPCYDFTYHNVLITSLTCNGWRIPLETEWEYAARGGRSALLDATTDDYLLTSAKNVENYLKLNLDSNDIGYLEFNSNNRSHPVRGLKPNPYDLYDMVGNVPEWCWDQNPTDSPNMSSNGMDNLKSVSIWGDHAVRGLGYSNDTANFSTEIQAITHRRDYQGNSGNGVRFVRSLY